MGYRSDLVIAVHKNIYTRNLITNEFPEILRNVSPKQHDDAFYWKLDGYKWYTGFPEIDSMETYFDQLDNEDQVISNDEHNSARLCYGAMRVGEENGDIQEWGSPYDYYITANISIDSPSE